MSMKLYFVLWPDKSFTIITGEMNSIDLFWKLDEEGDPYSVKVWSTTDPCAITSQMTDKGLVVSRDPDCLWKRVIMPSFVTVQKSLSNK